MPEVIVTPGVFFDVNPGSRRIPAMAVSVCGVMPCGPCRKFNSYDSFIRLSYGPSFKARVFWRVPVSECFLVQCVFICQEVQRGLDGMQRVIERHRMKRIEEDTASTRSFG